MGSAEHFYDDLAPHYDRLFADWEAAATWHGAVVGELLRSEGVHPPAALLDCTCGTGTQALPLAAQGYAVTATDVSARAVERAAVTAEARDLALTFAQADVRDVRAAVDGDFDAVVSCDNALPHLLDDADLDRALASLRTCLRPGGLLLASVRDYDALCETRPTGVPIALHGAPGSRHGSGQAWSWDGEHVDITLFTFAESSSGWEVSTHETRCRALRRALLDAALERSGFGGVRWLPPEQSGYYQPVVLARAV